MNMCYSRMLSICVCLLFSISLSAQVSFSKSDLSFEPSNHSVGIADVNGDFKDDVISYQAPRNIDLYIQTQNAGLLQTQELNIPNGDWDWMIMMGDYQNTGIKSFVSGGAYNILYVSDLLDLKDFNSEHSTIESSNMFAQGANSIDINNDGYLDLFVCHDDADSRFFMNNGDGTFQRTDTIIDFSSQPAYDGSGNYGSIWTYINDDDLIDLYIAKCRLGANSTEDPRRINQVYLQNEDGTFTRRSDLGLDIGWQSWAADFGDVDNDGDLDAFIVNHDAPHQLFENQGDSLFVEIESFKDLSLSGFDIQGIMEDFDNNGYIDFLIVGNRNKIVWNYGDFEFVEENIDFELTAYSAATGDVNSDGFIDVFCSYPGGLVANYSRPSMLFTNDGNENHHLSVSLSGVQSNKEGVGAKLVCYSSLGKQTRVVSSGEGYGIFNSLTSRFGLAQDELIDSLVVYWPSGLRQVIFDLEVNQCIVVTEGLCYRSILGNFDNPNFSICPNNNLILENPEGNVITWNQDQETTDFLEVSETGFYYATSVDSNGCVSATSTIFASSAEDEATPALFTDRMTACLGDSISLTALEDVIAWNNGATANSINVGESGMYFYESEGLCGTLISDTVELEFLSAVDLDDQEVFVPIGDDLRIELEDLNMYEWSFTDDFSELISTSNIFEDETIETDTIVYARNLIQLGSSTGQIGLSILEDDNEVDFDFVNIAMNFTVLRELQINSIKCATAVAGNRIIEILQDGNVVFSKEVVLQNGQNEVELNASLLPGEYSIQTNELTNIQLTGFPSPVMSRTNFVNFPIELEGLASINGPSDGTSTYYYFYNWDLSISGAFCYGTSGQYNIVFETSNTQELKDLGIELYPNPVSDVMILNSDIEEGLLSLYDVTGALIKTMPIRSGLQSFDFTDIKSGSYSLFIKSKDQTLVTKMIKL